MKYFITSVQTYSTSGKSRKGALLQSVASQFEGVIIDDDALLSMISIFTALVAYVNNNYKGKPLDLVAGPGWLCVKPEYNGNDNHIFNISYVPVKATYYAYNVEQQVSETLSNIDPNIIKGYKKGGVQ